MTINKEKDGRTFYASSVITTATILMAAGIAGFALLVPNQVIASMDNTIEEERVAVGGATSLYLSINSYLHRWRFKEEKVSHFMHHKIPQRYIT